MHCLEYASSAGFLFPLRAGSFARPTPVDWHNRGEPDLLVASRGGPQAYAVRLYRVTAHGSDGLPVYDTGCLMPELGPATALTCWPNTRDSRFDLICAVGRSLWLFPNHGNADRPSFEARFELPLSPEIASLGEVTKLCLADIERNGNFDLVLGLEDHSSYFPPADDSGTLPAAGLDTAGKALSVDEAGRWMGGTVRSLVVWLKNDGDLASPDFSSGGAIQSGPLPVQMAAQSSPALSDWDKDGLPELVTVDAKGRFCVRRPSLSEYGAREFSDEFATLTDNAGEELQCSGPGISLAAANLDRTGRDDLVIGKRNGAVLALRLMADADGGNLSCSSIQPLLTSDSRIHLGEFPVPAVIEWEGRPDLIVGTAEGEVYHLRNEDNSGVPAFASPELLPLGGVPWPYPPSPTPNVLGPKDEGMSYLCPAVTDWDGDGRPDLLVTDANGHITFFRNIGRNGQPEFAEGVRLQKARGPFATLWRVRPAPVLWNGNGLPELLSLDTYGFLNLYQRDGLHLKPGRKMMDAVGRPIQLDSAYLGCGQVYFYGCDWDGDGDTDLLVGLPERNAHVYQRLAGQPLPEGPAPSLLLLENIGTNESPSFLPRIVRFEGRPLHLGAQGCAPCAFPDNGGPPDLIAGADDGHLYFLQGADIEAC